MRILITGKNLVLTFSFTVSIRLGKEDPEDKNGCGEKGAKTILLLLCSNQETEKKPAGWLCRNLNGNGMSSNNQFYSVQRNPWC